MKVLWLCNAMTPQIAKQLGVQDKNTVSWIANTSRLIADRQECELVFCFPFEATEDICSGYAENIKYYGFYVKNKYSTTKYDKRVEERFMRILQQESPDVIHIWGTECFHTLAMLKVCKQLKLLDKATISIQGLMTCNSEFYNAALPERVVRSLTVRDVLKVDNIWMQQRKFKKKAGFELEAIRLAKNVIGRTDWDKALTKQANPNLNYFFNNAILREKFYNKEWDIKKCEPHTIFVSQGYYPIKGLHMVLKALEIIKRRYPDVKLYVSGFNIIKGNSLKEKLKLTSYGVYIKKLIAKYNLRDNVSFVGLLDEDAICDRYLKANVFVSASVIENESNSLGESKCLGVPTVASYVGGCTNFLDHKKDCLAYPFNEPYMLAEYVCDIFADGRLAESLSRQARKNALIVHSREENIDQLVRIYTQINNSGEQKC